MRLNARYVLFLFMIAASIFGTIIYAYAQDNERVPQLTGTAYSYTDFDLPPHFLDDEITDADNTPNSNPITDEGATLGRVLFYDTLLSANNSVSCASCHQQSVGFSDPAVLSVGFEGGLTGRHSMSLANARYYEPEAFFWDERAATLEEQVLLPIQDPVEMGLTLEEVVGRIESTSYYPDLFEEAFGTPDVTSDRVSLALSQFVRSLVSYQSKYDEGVADNFRNFTAQERDGRRIFNGPARCDNCHMTDLQIADETFNNGLDAITTDEGAGDGEFKVPSLRNIAVTGPYMHDGRFATLEEVVEFYDSGVQAHPNLARDLREGGGGNVVPRRLNLTDDEKEDLIAFLNTLTDEAFLTDPRFSDPFEASDSQVEPVETPVPTVIPSPTPFPTPDPALDRYVFIPFVQEE
ncbi:MAG: cytochrome c peroxidase [Chloroflexota bacterium]